MKCNKCETAAIENMALGKTFWYCRVCKDEVVNTAPGVGPVHVLPNDLWPIPWKDTAVGEGNVLTGVRKYIVNDVQVGAGIVNLLPNNIFSGLDKLIDEGEDEDE